MANNDELYKIFFRAAKSGSLSRAAKELYLTQPSISHAIKQLEERLGLPLFIRTSRGVVLTQEGAVLYSYIEQSQLLISLAEEKLAALKNLESGELRIGGSDSLFKHYLLPYLERYHQLYPSIRLYLDHGTTPEIISFLKAGKIDMGVVRLPILDPQLSVAETIQLQECFVAGDRFRALKGKVLTLEQLLRYPLILFSRNSRARMAITEVVQSYGLKLDPAIEVGSVELLKEFARRGLGIAYVTREFAAQEMKEGSLFELQLSIQLPPTQIGIMTMVNVPLSTSAGRFLDLMNGTARPC
jgi:DNA-binding transcriptional LysR family regulator